MNNWLAPNVTIIGTSQSEVVIYYQKIDDSSISINFYLNIDLLRYIGSASNMSDINLPMVMNHVSLFRVRQLKSM